MFGSTNPNTAAAAVNPAAETNSTSASTSAPAAPVAARPDADIWDDAEFVELPTDPETNALGRVPSYHTLAEEAGVNPLDRAPTYTTIQGGPADNDDVISLSTACHSEDNSRSATPTGFQDDEKSEKNDLDASLPAYDGSSDPVTDEKKPIIEKEDVPEEAPVDVLIDTLLEEIINDWRNGGPFVHRLMAYRTPSGEIVIRNEKIKIEDGTKLKMDRFEGSEFYGSYGQFAVHGQRFPDKIELSRNKSTMRQGNNTFNNMGTGQKVSIGNKAVCTNFNGNGMSYIFRVDGCTLSVSENGTILSNSRGSSSSNPTGSSQTFNFGNDMSFGVDMSAHNAAMDQMNRDMAQADRQMARDMAQMDRDMDQMNRGMARDMAQMDRDMAQMNQDMSRSFTPTFTAPRRMVIQPFSNRRGGRVINFSGPGAQFNSVNGINVGGVIVGNSMTLDEDGNVISIDGRPV